MESEHTDSARPAGRAIKIALLICGMHRGGTSASTRLISAFGADLGRSLLPTDPVDQPTGYWENEPLMKLNHAFLLSRGFKDYLAKDSRICIRRCGADVRKFEEELSSAIVEQFEGAPLIAIKDPRLCFLAPFYERPLAQLGYSTRYIIVVRPAHEVANSLHKRHAVPKGELEAIWIRTMLSAEKVSRGSPRIFIAFRDVVCAPASVYQRLSLELNIRWPTVEHDALKQVDHFFKPSVVSRLASASTPKRGYRVATELHDFLLKLGSGELATSERLYLATIKHNFRYFYSALSFRIIQNYQLSTSLEIKKEEFSNLQSTLQLAQKQATDLQSLLASQQSTVARLQEALFESETNLLLANKIVEETSANFAKIRKRLNSIESSPLWRLSFPIRWLWRLKKGFTLNR